MRNKDVYFEPEFYDRDNKLLELGYSGKRIKLILEDVTKQVVTNQLANDEHTIIEYINRRHRI